MEACPAAAPGARQLRKLRFLTGIICLFFVFTVVTKQAGKG
jgi:hypothetical protein